MASNTVEQIFVELLLNAKGYNKEADDAVKKSEKLEKGLGNTEKQSVKTNKSFDGLVGGLRKAVKGVAGLTAVIAAGTGLLKLAEEARKANDELNFLSKNLGMSSGEVKAWQGAAAAMGGSAQGMAGDMKGLNSSMNDFAMTGESSMLPMFNTLGVSMVDAQGKVRGTNDVMLDLADSMSKMDREQAFLMGQKLGFDEGTINTLLQGRDAMQEMVDYHKQMYTSNKQELEASRKLSENQAKLGAHWDSMKLMMGNAIIPLLVKLSDIALRFFEFLQRHQKTVKTVFEGMAIFLGMLVVPLLGKALVAALLFMAPFAPFILTVGLLAAAFIGLYQDYKTWAEGGKSLFNWGAFSGYIDNAKFSTENLGKGFLHLIGDYNSWSEVAEDGKSWLKLKGFIDENGVSLETLRKGFANLTTDLIQYMIPTLKEYGEIFQKLITGDFLGASKQAANMMANLGNKILSVFGTSGQEIADYISSGGQTRAPWQSAKDRISGAADVATGQPVGTLGNTSIFNEKSSKGGSFRNNMLASMDKYGIKNKNERKALLAITEHETGDGKRLSENANYSYKGWQGIKKNQRNVRKWLSNHNEADFKKLSKEDKLNIMYEGMNGNNQKGDGWKFRGRGAIQLTGRSIYQEYAKYANRPDIMKNPDLIATDQKLAADSAAWYWSKHNKTAAQKARNGDFTGARVSVNGGTIGMDDYKSRLGKISDSALVAQSSIPKANIPSSIAKPVTNNKSNNVEVNVNKIEVNTSSSTMTGAMEDAIKGLNNNDLYQFPIGLNT